MAKFDFVQECLVKVWERCVVSVEADSLEEAKEIIMSHGNDVYSLDDENVEYEDNEMLYETLELERPENNGGIATNEWYVGGEKKPFFSNKPE